jgi:hypothetical protein
MRHSFNRRHPLSVRPSISFRLRQRTRCEDGHSTTVQKHDSPLPSAALGPISKHHITNDTVLSIKIDSTGFGARRYGSAQRDILDFPVRKVKSDVAEVHPTPSNEQFYLVECTVVHTDSDLVSIQRVVHGPLTQKSPAGKSRCGTATQGQQAQEEGQVAFQDG